MINFNIAFNFIMNCDYLYKSSVVLKKLSILVDKFDNICKSHSIDQLNYPFNTSIDFITSKIPKINDKINKLHQLLNITINYDFDCIHYSSINADDICMLCRESITTNIVRFECGHYIHRSCYFQYKYLGSTGIINKNQAKCPYCRTTINYINNIYINDYSLIKLLNKSLIQTQLDENIKRCIVLKNQQLCFLKLKYHNTIDMILINMNNFEQIDRNNILNIENAQFNQIINNSNQFSYSDIIEIWNNSELNYSGKHYFKKNYKNISDLVKNSNNNIPNTIIHDITLWILFRILLKNNVIHKWIELVIDNHHIIKNIIPIELDPSYLNWNCHYFNMSLNMLNNCHDLIDAID